MRWPRPFRRRLAPAGLVLPALACCLILGCGGRPKAYHVSGTVTFAGQPIPTGKIYFTPDGNQKNTGPAGYADIKDGKYNTQVKGGQGMVGGPMIVRIEGADGVAIDEERPNGKPLFPAYETPVEMPKSSTTKDFDVPASAIHQRRPGGEAGAGDT